MDFFDVVRTRRSARHFTSEPVSEADLKQILEAGRRAPSATNEQPWRFIVVRERETRVLMKEVTDAIIQVRLEDARGGRNRQRIERMRFYSEHFAEAPVVIAVLGHPYPIKRPVVPPPPSDPGLQSVAAAIAQMHLASTALGYGSCWTTAPVDFAAAELEAILGVEKPWYLAALLPIGHVSGLEPAPRRKPLKEVVRYVG